MSDTRFALTLRSVYGAGPDYIRELRAWFHRTGICPLGAAAIRLTGEGTIELERNNIRDLDAGLGLELGGVPVWSTHQYTVTEPPPFPRERRAT